MQNKKNNKNRGYTIIETMIAVSLFLIVMMIGMGALLNANLIHGKSQNLRSIMDNLSFIMDDMSRNLRTGSEYHCILSTETSPFGTTPLGCSTGGVGISFKSTHDSSVQQWVYRIESNSISKSIDGTATPIIWMPLTPEEVKIDQLSGFTVTGAESGDSRQPFVTIRLVGVITYKGIDTAFNLQTSVSQRLLDR